MFKFRPLLLALVLGAAPGMARAQAPPPAPQAPAPKPVPAQAAPAPGSQTVCTYPIPAPASLPPAGSAPVVYLVVPCFQKQGGSPVVESNTYLYYIEMKNHVSVPSANKWVPYD